MSDDLVRLDRDGALAEALGPLGQATRRRVLRTLAAAGLIGSAGLAAAGAADAAAEPQGDIAILNYALTLEYLQSAFYTEVERIGSLTGETARLARIVGGHERAHVRMLLDVLGHRAVAKPSFDFHGATDSQNAFVRTAVAFEDLGVAAYKGQAPRIASPAYLGAALAIHATEARHAAWIRRIAGILPAQSAFDQPASATHVVSVVDSTHFIVGRTEAAGMPGFTG
ncbi:MAG TPA: ferritin-like domain-containing protein [Gaiellales bacterium]|nr:ferritin-like domain-containing protein [Gaiellales bacterium]